MSGPLTREGEGVSDSGGTIPSPRPSPGGRGSSCGGAVAALSRSERRDLSNETGRSDVLCAPGMWRLDRPVKWGETGLLESRPARWSGSHRETVGGGPGQGETRRMGKSRSGAMPEFTIRFGGAKAPGSIDARALFRSLRPVHRLPSPGILIQRDGGALMRIHHPPCTGKVEVKGVELLRGRADGFPRIVRRRLNVKSASASTTGMPM
jgi:hypothetical protein